jgi:hypothetical protein
VADSATAEIGLPGDISLKWLFSAHAETLSRTEIREGSRPPAASAPGRSPVPFGGERPAAGPRSRPPPGEVKSNGRSQRLVCEVKRSGHPRIVRAAIDHLRYFLEPREKGAYGVVIAPCLSAAAQEICREENVGFLDFEGNCRLVFDGVFIERAVPLRAATERREIKSIFAPKSAQLLRLLLRDPKLPWKVAELAEQTRVSLGHISNVRHALIDREWARSEREASS